MVNKICALLSVSLLSAFLIGLAYSIEENTGSIAFPVMTAIVLLLAYKSCYDELTGSGSKE